MQGDNPRPTFWERLGRGVAQGWEAARETSARLGELAGLKLDLKNARDHLDGRYRLLGRIAADRLLDRAEGSVEAAEPAVAAVLEEVRAAVAALADLERRIAESDPRPGGHPPSPPPAGPGTAGSGSP